MAFLDIAADTSYGRYNIKFASIVGLNTAVYWSCLMNVFDRVREKQTCDENGYFVLNREYVTKKTTLALAQQQECDEILAKLGLLDKDKDDKITCDIKKFFMLITTEDTDIVDEVKIISQKATKEGKAEGKRVGIINRLVSKIAESDSELLAAYRNWLEVVYDKGVCRQPPVDLFVTAVNSYTKDKSVKLDLIKLATTLGYREFTWVQSTYEKDHKQVKLPQQKISSSISEINKKFEF